MEPTVMEQLYQFVTSYPIDTDICEKVRRLIDGYITETLKMDYYHVMLDGKQVSDAPGLETPRIAGKPWCNDGAEAVPIYGNESSYRAQSTFAYQEQKPLWISAKNHHSLHEESEYTDHWTSTLPERLPDYNNKQKRHVKTSIIIPLRHGASHVFGFLCLESNQYRICSEPAKVELLRLGASVGAALSSHEDYLEKRNNAITAIEAIEQSAQDRRFDSPLEKPTIFIASSAHADSKVIALIREVIGHFQNSLHECYWQEDRNTGDIDAHLRQMISQCKFGICYFSEPAKGNGSDECEYIDNPNVMLEAGMLHSLIHSPAAAPLAWIPIREQKSPPMPFDLSHQRIIGVKRLGADSCQINQDAFTSELRDRIDELLRNHYPGYTATAHG